jgi:hypothetical protein
MLIVVSLALLMKWSIIKPIHDDIIDKYQHYRPLFYAPHSICHVFNYNKFNLIMFPISCLLVLIFAMEYKRVSFMSQHCRGHFAPPVPVDFLTHKNHKLVAVIFAVCANQLFEIVNETFQDSGSVDQGVILVFLQQIFKVLLIGFRYYPILTSIYIDTWSSLILGTFYIWLEFPISIIEQDMCQSKYYSSEQPDNYTNESHTRVLLDYYGTGSFLVNIDLCTDIPRYFCMAFISIRLPMKVFDKLWNSSNIVSNTKELTTEAKTLLSTLHVNSVEMIYLRNLTGSRKNDTAKGWIYEWRHDFRYSSRVLSVYSSIFLFLYFVLIRVCIQVIPYMSILQKLLQFVIDSLNGTVSTRSIPLLVRPFLLAIVSGVSVIIIQLFLLLTSIRRNLFQVYRGDDSEIPRRKRSAFVSYAIGNFHFAGYFIGYVIWGLFLLVFISFLLFVSIDILIAFKAVRIFESILKVIIPVFLLIYFKNYLNKFLARFAFLQEGGDVLAVNNRRILMIFLYFNFFLDAFLGLLSSIMRLVLSLLGGIIYMCRIDYSPFGRKLETFDNGFNAYCGFIHTECAHRHPILLIFAAHLLNSARKKQQTNSISMLMMESDETSSQTDKTNWQRSCRLVRKWRTAVFLVRNPSIVYFRKAYLNQFHMNDNQTSLNNVKIDTDQTIIHRQFSV